MRLLLDTHTFLWFIRADSRLTLEARRLIESAENERLLSVASLWEMAIKYSLGKLDLALPFTSLVEEHVTGNAIALLPIAPDHLDVMAKLPFHHKDPFDRLIVAQGLSETVPILSKDESFDRYGVERLWQWDSGERKPQST